MLCFHYLKRPISYINFLSPSPIAGRSEVFCYTILFILWELYTIAYNRLLKWDRDLIFFLLQTYSHQVYFDRDVVLHIEQKPNRIFSCYVYQMVCDSENEDDHTSYKKKKRLCCKKGGRIFEYF